MTIFDVRNAPQKLYLGGQPQISLINDGPYTVYLGEDPTVSPLNGFELPPTGQMTWKSERELWAVTRTINTPVSTNTLARLITNLAGELSLTTRAKFYENLYATDVRNGVAWSTQMLEVGHVTNLIITRSAPALATLAVEDITLTWYDDDFNVLRIEQYEAGIIATTATSIANPSSSDPSLRAVIPVKGKFVTLTGSGTSTGSVIVVGTDAPMVPRTDGGIYSSVACTPTWDGHIASFSNITLNSANPAHYIMIPAIGDQCDLLFSNGAATAVAFAFWPNFITLGPMYEAIVSVGAGVNLGVLLEHPPSKYILIEPLAGSFTGNITARYPREQNSYA